MKNLIQNKPCLPAGRCKTFIAIFAFLLFAGNSFANCAASYTASVNGQTVTFINTSTGTNVNTYYYWDLGDGNYDNTANTTHTYQYGGTYQVCMTIYDSLNNNSCYSTFCDSVVIVGPQAPCHASFYASSSNNSGSFSSTSTGTTPYTVYNWSFGDNTYGTGANVNHTYSNPGWYTVCLAITDVSTQCADSFCQMVYINGTNNTTCSASFTHTTNGQTVTFTNTSTGTNITTGYYWDFGDSNSGNNQNEVHTYLYGGTYTVCLSIWDSLNWCSDTYCDTVTVSGPNMPCNANFVTYPDTSNLHNTWVYNLATGTNPMQYTWSWGDNTPDSYLQYPSHTYANSGQYTICLTIVDANLCTSTWCDVVNVQRLSAEWVASPSTINVVNPSGINEVNVSHEISIYPNPATDVFYVSGKNLENMNYKIYDVLGNEVLNGSLQNNSVNVNELTPAIYIFKVTDAKGNAFTKQFIKN